MIIGPIKNALQSGFPFSLTFGTTFLIVVSFCVASVTAEEQLTEGSSNKKFRKQTVQSIPLQKLNQQTRDKISGVLNKPSIYRRLPVTAISADPDHFRFLVRHPEVIVKIWQLMGVTQMETKRTGPYTVKTNDGAGTISSLELVYGTENLHIFYGTGTYEGPVLKRKLTGDCVLVLRSESQVGVDGKPVQTSQLDVFLRVRNATIGLIAKTIQPLVGTTADHNFVESLKFVQRLNETTAKNGPGVEQMSKRLDIDADVRRKYVEIIDLVFQRAINSSAPVEARGMRQANPVQQPARNLDPRNYSTTGQASPTYNSRSYQAQPASYPKPTQPRTIPRSGSSSYGRVPNYGQPSMQAYPGYGSNRISDNRISGQELPPIYPASPAEALPARRNQPPRYPGQTASGQYAYPAPATAQEAQQQLYSAFQNPDYHRQAYGAHGYQGSTYSGQSNFNQRPVQAQFENFNHGRGGILPGDGQVRPAGGWNGR